MADEQIELEYLLKADKALADLERVQGMVSGIKAQLQELASQTGTSLQAVAASMRETFKQQKLGGLVDPQSIAEAKASIKDYNQALSTALREASQEAKAHENSLKDVDTELKQKPQDANGFASALSNLGKVGQYVLGTVLGISAVRVLSEIRRWFSEAAQAGIELEQTIFRLEASVRGLQARGIDVSMKETEAAIKSLRSEFKQFTTQEIAGSIANIQLLTANFSFSREQMDQVQRATVALATIMGKDLDEAARQVSLFMSSGYSEGLQRAGLAVNKLTVQEEAHRLGINKSYMALTEEERAFAALNVVMNQTKYLEDEAIKFQQSEAGQLQIQAKRWEELKTAIGDKFVPAMIAGYKIAMEFINALLSQLGKVGAYIFNSLVTPFLTAIAVMDMWKSGAITNLADVEKAVGDVYTQLSKQVEKQFQLELKPEVKLNLSGDNPLGQKIPTDTAQNYAADLQKIFMDIVKANQKFNDDMAKAQQDFLKDYGSLTDQQLNGVFASWNNFWNSNGSASQEQQDQFLASMQTFMGKFGDITEKGLEKAAEIWQKYYDKINDINQKEQDQIAAENQKYQQQVQDLHDDTQQKLEDAARKYHDAEIKAEREFQEKMRRLREEFLFDLEDALRERDALQVLRLIRRYKLDVEQANRQYELERQERLDAYKQEIEDIKRQAAEKAKQLAEEHANRLAEIQKAAEDERKQAEEDRQKALDQLLSDMQKERDKRQEEYDAQIQQLKDEYQKQLTEMLTQYGLQLGSTQSFGDAMTQLLGSYFGPGGAVDGIYSYLGSIIQQSVAEAQAALTQLLAMQAQAQQISDSMNTQSSTDVSPGGYSDSGATGGQMSGGGNASGGLLFANTPQLAMFGEVPELVQFTPISKLNTQSMTSTGTSGTGMGSGNGKVTVRIELDSGLVGSIVDKSLNEVAASLEVARSNRR